VTNQRKPTPTQSEPLALATPPRPAEMMPQAPEKTTPKRCSAGTPTWVRPLAAASPTKLATIVRFVWSGSVATRKPSATSSPLRPARWAIARTKLANCC